MLEGNTMASMVTHAAVGLAAAAACAPKGVSPYFFPASILCATVQDVDVIGFYFRLPYGSILGHRGFSHSLFIGLAAAMAISSLLVKTGGLFSRMWLFYLVFFFLVWASHGVLDAMTRGGYGAALLWPFDGHRLAFSFAPIPISPIGLSTFLSKWGWNVLKAEFCWVWLPASVLVFCARALRAL
ncbi:MAG TPA: metal-dependent hydrolase [Thermodesulfobacteriota bacterium]|nr:metal-dependent hydrolase [Thermodesulfobacteriota bacterium]